MALSIGLITVPVVVILMIIQKVKALLWFKSSQGLGIMGIKLQPPVVF
jgi:hypothetical protein